MGGLIGNRAVAALVAAVVVYLLLVALIGYPVVICTAVLAAWGALAVIVVLAADLREKPSPRAAPETTPAPAKA